MILLTGVLALSWRLTEEPSLGSPQQTTQSALIPSLGLLEHHPESAADEPPACETDDLLPIDVSDSELTNNESTNLLRRASSGGTYGTLESSHRSVGYLTGVARPRVQRRSITEVEEIWGELEDNGCAGERERLVRNRSLKWPRHHQTQSRREPRDEESSPLFGNVRVKKALWRWSDLGYMSPSQPAQQPPSSTPGSSGSESQPAGPTSPLKTWTFLREGTTGAWRVPQLQEATGGWWKMRWWRKKDAANDGGGAGDGALTVGATSPPSLTNSP